jgi:hypothetical protein
LYFAAGAAAPPLEPLEAPPAAAPLAPAPEDAALLEPPPLLPDDPVLLPLLREPHADRPASVHDSASTEVTARTVELEESMNGSPP